MTEMSAAQAEAERRYPEHDQPGRDDFVAGAQWQAARYRALEIPTAAECICHPGYKERGLIDHNCHFHEYEDFFAAVAALAENPAPARSERDITKPPIIVGIDAEDEEWMNASLGTPRPQPDEAMVERVAEAISEAYFDEDWHTVSGIERDLWLAAARAALFGHR